MSTLSTPAPLPTDIYHLRLDVPASPFVCFCCARVLTSRFPDLLRLLSESYLDDGWLEDQFQGKADDIISSTMEKGRTSVYLCEARKRKRAGSRISTASGKIWRKALLAKRRESR